MMLKVNNLRWYLFTLGVVLNAFENKIRFGKHSLALMVKYKSNHSVFQDRANKDGQISQQDDGIQMIAKMTLSV